MKKILIFAMSMIMVISCFSGCGKEDESKLHTHDISEVSMVEATCTEQGNIHYYKCNKCGKYFKDEKGENEITDKNSVVISAKGHKIVHHDKKQVTCEEPGWDAYDTCENCDYSTFKIIQPIGHQFELLKVIEEGDCENSGKAVYKCKVCGKTTERTIEAKGHKVDKYTYNNDATCTTDGTEWGICSICGKKVTRVAVDSATGHTPDKSKTVVVEPTCTQKGYTKNVCSVCGESYINGYKDALGHDMSKEINIEKNCEHGTITGRECSRCGFKELNEADDKLKHDFDENGICKICKKHLTCANIFEFSEEKYKGQYDGENKRWIFTANEEVLANKAPFNITIPVEIVNLFVEKGYSTLSFNFERRLKNMATFFSYNKISQAHRYSITLPVEKDKPMVIENFHAYTPDGWVGQATHPDDPNSLKWVAADGFILTLGYSLNYNKNEPLSYFESNERFSINQNGQYYFNAGEYATTNITIKQGYIDDALKLYPDGIITITATTAGDFGGGIGIKNPDEPESAYKYSNVSLKRTFNLCEIKEKGLSFDILYGNSALNKKPMGFNFEISVSPPIDYTKAENWFTATVDCKKVSDDTFEFTFPSVTGVPNILRFNEDAKNYLIDNGYIMIRITYQSKDGENANISVSKDNTVNPYFNQGKPKTRDIVLDEKFVGLNSFYVAVNGEKATGIKLTLKAIQIGA